MKRTDVISNHNIQPGDVIVGMSSYGQASYEKEYNGGMGSNGLTSARHDVFSKYLAKKYPESYDAAVPEALVYSGNLKLTDQIKELGIDAGKLVLSPTLHLRSCYQKLLDQMRPLIHGMVHALGGAQTKVMHFVENLKILKTTYFQYLLYLKLYKNNQEQIGKRCIKSSIWDIAWKYILHHNMPKM